MPAHNTRCPWCEGYSMVGAFDKQTPGQIETHSPERPRWWNDWRSWTYLGTSSHTNAPTSTSDENPPHNIWWMPVPILINTPTPTIHPNSKGWLANSLSSGYYLSETWLQPLFPFSTQLNISSHDFSARQKSRKRNFSRRNNCLKPNPMIFHWDTRSTSSLTPKSSLTCPLWLLE